MNEKVFTVMVVISYQNDSDCNGSYTRVCRTMKTARKAVKEAIMDEIDAYYEGCDIAPSGKERREIVKKSLTKHGASLEICDKSIKVEISETEIED